ncbi:MAG: MFS transporter [Thermodesulfovibrionales bacterium]|nr:MFS transporter [Thermodesulfovibrionales bacterium]
MQQIKINQGQRYFPALHIRDFRLFWFSQMVSLSGTWMHSTAQAWLVYSLTQSPFYLGLIAFLSSFPLMFLTFYGGLIADRYNKRDILLITQGLSIIPALFLAILTYTELIKVWHIGLMALFLGLINAFDIPARQSFFAELVGKEQVTNAIALNSMAFNSARVIGPLLAGFVIVKLGMAECFFLNALSFIPVLFVLLFIRRHHIPQTRTTKNIDAFKEGFYFVRHNRPIMFILLMIATFSLFAIPFINLLPVISKEVFKMQVGGLSILMASLGVGSFLGAFILAFVKTPLEKRLFIPLSSVVFIIALVIVTISSNFYLTSLALVFCGWGIVTFLALCNGFIQERVDDERRGRVISLYVFVFLGLSPVGNLILGLSADMFGTMDALRMFSLSLCIVVALFVITFRRSCEDTCS